VKLNEWIDSACDEAAEAAGDAGNYGVTIANLTAATLRRLRELDAEARDALLAEALGVAVRERFWDYDLLEAPPAAAENIYFTGAEAAERLARARGRFAAAEGFERALAQAAERTAERVPDASGLPF